MKLFFVSFFILVADQASKLYVKGFYVPAFRINHTGLPRSTSIPIIKDLFYITPVENPGIAFGIELGPEFKAIISVFTILATLGLLIYFFKIRNENLLLRFSVAVILGGAMGNLMDRIFYGYFYGYAPIFSGNVVDFLDLRLFSFFMLNKTFSIYVFNLADVAISIGVCVLLYALTKKRKVSVKNDMVKVENNFSID